MNYNIQIDLLKLRNAKVEDMIAGGRSRLCVCIPLEDNVGPIKYDGTSCYLSLAAFELPEPKNGQTHFVKPLLPRSQVFGMSTAAVRAIPYVGNMKPWDKPSPQLDCGLCTYSAAAKYASGGYYRRCTHPLVNKNTTGDVRYMDECPKDKEKPIKP